MNENKKKKQNRIEDDGEDILKTPGELREVLVRRTTDIVKPW
jgi:hypothetical protein